MKYTGCLLDAFYGQVKEILQPIEFICVVKGEKLKAQVIAEIANPINWYLRVKFSDGYVSDFYATSNGKWFDTANDGEDRKVTTPYVFAIKNELSDFISYDHNGKNYCFQLPINGKEANVFVFFSNDDEFGPRYTVRYNGDYRFTLVRKGNGWEVFSVRKLGAEKINAELARNICLLIESKED